ncbi:probable E3 ubiquitin-protein ligase HIP1 [Primulina eburnea]|uniref:probable E3 ubiquitin-protein ligase HIP1 n=1 Tax=Primulina eburnea TaxID=1245227 RepID=UPI003C6C7570
MEYHHVSSRFSQPPAIHILVANGENYGFVLPIPIPSVDSIWGVGLIIGCPLFESHPHGDRATIRQSSRGTPFQPSGSLQGGVHEDDVWIINARDHHPLHSTPEASPQAPSTRNGLTDQHNVSKFLETRNSDASGSDEEICVVCQDDLINDRIATLDCRHRYHVECIKTWLTMKNFCPICKAVAINNVDS